LAFLLLLLAAWPMGGPDAAAVASCYLASWWAAAAISWPSLRRQPGTPPAPGRAPTAGRMLARGLPLMLVTLTNQAQLSADLLVAGWALGLAEAGDYYLASQIAVAGLLFANAANQLALARLPVLRNEPEEFAAALARAASQLVGLALALAAALGAAAPWLLPRLFGAEHAGAVTALLALLPWLVLQHLSQLLQGALTAAGRERAVLRGNLVLAAVLAPALAAAAAGGTLAAFALARSAGEAARLWWLFRSLRGAGLARR
jgi:O-antigen/teichoic acid export membrane protein